MGELNFPQEQWFSYHYIVMLHLPV